MKYIKYISKRWHKDCFHETTAALTVLPTSANSSGVAWVETCFPKKIYQKGMPSEGESLIMELQATTCTWKDVKSIYTVILRLYMSHNHFNFSVYLQILNDWGASKDRPSPVSQVCLLRCICSCCFSLDLQSDGFTGRLVGLKVNYIIYMLNWQFGWWGSCCR